jgi:uncharacterized cupin superfamily protein
MTYHSQGEVVRAGQGRPIDLESRKFLIKAAAGRPGGRDFSVLELTVEAGDPGPIPHTHNTYEELFYILEGEFDFLVGDDRHRVGPGDLVRIPPGCQHAFSNPGTKPARWLGIACPAGIEMAFEEMAELRTSGRLSAETLMEVGRRYDTEHHPDIVGWATPTDGLTRL